MLRYALGEPLISDIEIERIKRVKYDQSIAQLMIPLNCGTIKSINGLEEIMKMEGVDDLLQYYHVGDTIEQKHIGTLNQHFGRFTLHADSLEGIIKIVEEIQKILVIESTEGKSMYTMLFDTHRLKN